MSIEEDSKRLAAYVIDDTYKRGGAIAIRKSAKDLSSQDGMTIVQDVMDNYVGFGQLDERVLQLLSTGSFSVDTKSLLRALIELIDNILALPEALWESYIAEL